MTLERGAFLYNRYRILEILGQGGMGSIYRAIDDNLGVEVAVKENLFTTDEYARQFRREAVILANLRHPNLPRVSDHFVIDGQGQYLVMDYIEGEDLRERMDRLGVISESEVLVMGAAICDALSYMHTRKPPVLHRDIKPGNVKITPQGQIYLVDFGLAKVVHAGQQTSTGARAMTPGYSPPEQYGAARTDHRSDIYSLGATMYAALVGVIPEDSLARTMEQTELTPIRKRNTKISRRTASAVEKALEVHPDDRFQDADEFKQALLNARGVTIKKLVEQGTLPPPPEDEVPGISLDGFALPPGSDKIFKKESTPLPLPISTPLSPDNYQDPPKPRRKKRKRSCLTTLLMLTFLVIVGVGALSFLNPTLFNRFWSQLPALASALPKNELFSGDGEYSTTIAPTDSENQNILATNPPLQKETSGTLDALNPAETLLPPQTSTPTPTPTDSISPTPSIIPTATPMGGGYGQIAFSSDSTGVPQIWLVNMDSTGLKRITNIQKGACQSDWSPDGSRLVFISPCQENKEMYEGSSLYIVNSDGSELTPLPTIGGGDYDPSWSPDGTKIVFTSLRNGNRPQIFVMNLETNDVQQLSEDSNRDFHPSWSADGTQIIFATLRNGPLQIWTMAADGTNPQLFSRSGSKINTHPVWSPDGQVVIYTQKDSDTAIPRLVGARYPDGAENEFNVYPFPGSTPMREADFSPDGFWLVIESWPNGSDHEIFLMTINGAESIQLTNNSAFDFDPAWRPIGQ
jgi:serine/threonine protein kinase